MEKYFKILLIAGLLHCINAWAGITVDGNRVAQFVIGEKPPRISPDELILRKNQADENNLLFELIRTKIKGVPIDVEVYEGKVWRITIKNPGLFRLNGIDVGVQAEKVVQAGSRIDFEMGPGPTLVLIPKRPCGVSYVTDARIGDEINSMDRDVFEKNFKKSKVTLIYVTGCKAE